MEKGLKWLFGGLIAAVVMMFMLMVSSVDAHEVNSQYWNDSHYIMNGMSYYNYCDMYPSMVIPEQQRQTTSSAENYINKSVTRDNEFQPNVTVNTPKPQR